MSRTKRNPSCKFYNLRRIKTKGTKVKENGAVDALKEEGYKIPSRLRARGNPRSPVIPSSWDDIYISALGEIPCYKGVIHKAVTKLLDELCIHHKRLIVKECYRRSIYYSYVYSSNGDILGIIECTFQGKSLKPILIIKWDYGLDPIYI